VLFGLGGSGKTQAARRFEEVHADAYDEIWWVTASDAGGIVAGARRVANALGLDMDALTDSSIQPAVAMCCQSARPGGFSCSMTRGFQGTSVSYFLVLVGTS
jgi:hypothetical protein